MMVRESKSIKFRIVLVSIFYMGLFGILAIRGYQLQIYKGEELRERAERQLTRKISLAPVRGNILDRNGEELASNRDAISIFVQPEKVRDPNETARILSKIVNQNESIIKSKIVSHNSFVWIKRSLFSKKEDLEKINKTEGIGFLHESRRYYPNMELAGHLIGFAGIDSQGLEGIELRYDKYIKGSPGFFMAERDALGRNIYPEGFNRDNSTRGKNVTLTIDKTIQYITERELGAAVKEYDAKGGVALVMDPFTGEVLSMSVQPSFNPNFYEDYSPGNWRNRAITDTFEPGSTFKIFLAAAALDSGKVSPKDIFYCENGSLKVFDKTIHDEKEHGWLSFENIIKVSSNVGAYKIAEKTGRKEFYNYIKRFGFGEKTGIGLSGEASGYVRSVEKISPVGFANLAFGQGLSVTAIQMLNAISAVANGGHLMRPYVVKKITDGDGRIVFSNYPLRVRRVISERAAREASSMLKRVVSPGGTGARAALEGYQVAGKTGTSQKYDFEAGSYSRDRHISSFIGFLPADDPRLSILVLLDEPKKSYYGGRVAAPVFKRIAEQVIAYMKISPVNNNTMLPLLKLAKNENRVNENSDHLQLTSKNPREMPNLKGLTLRKLLKIMNLPPAHMIGNGVVVGQDPKAGGIFNRETGYSVWFGEVA